jgi:glycosyltransferase involved in cell wall biosynthesis
MSFHSSHPIRVAVLLQDLEFGGTQRYALHLLRHMDRERFAPELWVLRGGDDMVPIARDLGVPIIHLSHDATAGPRTLVRLAVRLFTHRPDLLYTLTVVPNIWGRLFGRMARVPAVVSGYRSLYPKQGERWLWRFADKIICNAEALKKIMVDRFSVPAERIAVIPNAVDMEAFRPTRDAKASDPTVLFVGRLVSEKDPLNLVESFKLVADKLPEARFQMIGGGPLREVVQARIRECGLESKLELVPGAADVRPWLNRAWVFVLASAMEASPNVIIEAMAMGLPVVATRVGGIPELVADKQTGFLVDSGDRAALADALVALLADETLRKTMGDAGRERVVLHHTLENMVQQTERVFVDALDGARKGR